VRESEPVTTTNAQYLPYLSNAVALPPAVTALPPQSECALNRPLSLCIDSLGETRQNQNVVSEKTSFSMLSPSIDSISDSCLRIQTEIVPADCHLNDLLDESALVCDPKDELNSNCFRSSNVSYLCEKETLNMLQEDLMQWQSIASNALKTLKLEKVKHTKVLYNYKVMKRRLDEQHKLLCIHNERSIADAEIHQDTLRRVNHLEKFTEELNKNICAERELRYEQEEETKRVSIVLSSTLKDFRALENEKSSASKELQVKEKLRSETLRLAQMLETEKRALETAYIEEHEKAACFEQEKVCYKVTYLIFMSWILIAYDLSVKT